MNPSILQIDKTKVQKNRKNDASIHNQKQSANAVGNNVIWKLTPGSQCIVAENKNATTVTAGSSATTMNVTFVSMICQSDIKTSKTNCQKDDMLIKLSLKNMVQ